jgi:hypothetical protein
MDGNLMEAAKAIGAILGAGAGVGALFKVAQDRRKAKAEADKAEAEVDRAVAEAGSAEFQKKSDGLGYLEQLEQRLQYLEVRVLELTRDREALYATITQMRAEWDEERVAWSQERVEWTIERGKLNKRIEELESTNGHSVNGK